MQNEFLHAPLLSSHHKRAGPGDINQKDELIHGLELKNERLRTEIIKIQNVIDEISAEEFSKKTKREPIMQSSDDQAVLENELLNAFKRIKMYEYEIGKMEEAQGQKSLTDKIKQLEAAIQEKKRKSDKLRAKLQAEQKKINDNTKKLSNNNYQQQIQKRMKNLNSQANFLRDRYQQLEAKNSTKNSYLNKQNQLIKRLRDELVKSGMSEAELSEIQARTAKSSQRSLPSENQYRTPEQKNKSENGIEEKIEDRTKDHFKEILNQIKLLEKMQMDYEKKIEQLQAQKTEGLKLNLESRNRLVEVEHDIEKHEKEIMILKGQVLPRNMKPLRPLRSTSSHAPTKVDKSFNAHKPGKILTHILKFDEVGMTSEKGQRFTDRTILGKAKLNTKIVGLTVFVDQINGGIAGIQALYSNKKKGGVYVKRDRQGKDKQYTEEKLTCSEGDWIKGINGTLNLDGKLESLYIITANRESRHFCLAKTTNKSFSFDIAADQIPVCIFGSLILTKQVGKWQHSSIQHFGVQILEQKQTEKQI